MQQKRNHKRRRNSLPSGMFRKYSDRAQNDFSHKFEMKPLSVESLDLAGPSRYSGFGQEEGRQTPNVQTSCFKNDRQGLLCDEFPKLNLHRNKPKIPKSVSGVLQIMELFSRPLAVISLFTKERQVNPREGGETNITSQKPKIFVREVTVNEIGDTTNESELATQIEDLHAAYETSISRPCIVRRHPTCYVPIQKKSTAVPRLLKERYWRTSFYSSPVLALSDRCSYNQLEDGALHTYAQLWCNVAQLKYLQAAVLAVYLLRHRVMVVEGFLPWRRRCNAYQSFKKDLVGKFCCSEGDLLYIPKFHKDVTISRTILWELQLAMKIMQHLDGPHSPVCEKIDDPERLTQEVRDENLVCNLLLPMLDFPIDLYFKPVFTQLHFHMVVPKARLGAEVLQAAALLFINLTEEALWNENFGAALFLAQNIRRCTNRLSWILAHDDIENTYLFTMMEWYWVRCYFNVGSHWSEMDQMKTDYIKTVVDLKKFTSNFFLGLSDSASHQHEYSFPDDKGECMNLSATGYKKIAVPPSWRWSTYQKVCSVALDFHYRIMDWAKSVIEKKPEETYEKKIPSIREIYSELENIILQRSAMESRFLFYRVLLLGLSAKCCRFLAASMDCICVKDGGPSSMTKIPFSYTYADKRSNRQRNALKLLIEIYQTEPTENLRTVLLQTARQTFFDEVIYLVQRQASDPIRMGGLGTITRLLPYVLHLWFGDGVHIQPGGPDNAIPPEEKKIFDQIMAMMFMGSALINCLMYLGSTDEELKALFLNNAMYYHAMFWPYFQRPTVMFEVLNAFSDYLYLAETGTIEYFDENFENGAARCCAVLLRYVVCLLPMLWEMCISHKHNYGPEEGERNFVISKVKYPVPYATLRFGTTTEVKLLKTHDRIIDFLHYDLGLSSSEQGRRVVLRGDSGPNIEPENIILEPRYHDTLRDTSNEDIPVASESLPPLIGYCGCPGVYEGCPIERYHDIEERSFITEETLHHELLDEVFLNLTTNFGNRKSSLDALMLDLWKTIQRLLGKTISEFEKLENEEMEEITVASLGENPPYNLRLDCLLKDLTRTAGYLNFPDPPVLVVTRVLSSLDEIFHGKQTHAMLRGSFQ